MTLGKTTSFFILVISIVYILMVGKNLIIPFVFALLLWFVIREIRRFIDKSRWLRQKLPDWVKSLFASILIVAFLGMISKIITNSIKGLSKSYKIYEANVTDVIENFNATFNVDLMEMARDQLGDFDFGALLTALFNSLSDIFSSAFIIIIYALFIFLEEVNFGSKLRAIFSENEKFETIIEILNRIERSVSQYLGLKTLVSLVTGTLSYVALYFIGIDSPEFWAFLIFLLNFIPTIGSLIATLFPAVFSLLQFGEITPFVLVLVIVGVIQLAVGNILEPKVMGNSLNISPLVAILSLSFWGAIWGVTGMILSVPITVIMVIVFSQFDQTRSVALLLSEKGKLS
ncbi:MAG: AI-2E family transporter [Vicingaceae bacterium]